MKYVGTYSLRRYIVPHTDNGQYTRYFFIIIWKQLQGYCPT